MRLFTSTTARKARCRKAGLAAARYWRQYGFENLKRAREARSINAARRRAELMHLEAEQRHTLLFPHGWMHVWYCSCGLTGYADRSVIPLHREVLGLDAPGSSGQRIVRVPTALLEFR